MESFESEPGEATWLWVSEERTWSGLKVESERERAPLTPWRVVQEVEG